MRVSFFVAGALAVLLAAGLAGAAVPPPAEGRAQADQLWQEARTRFQAGDLKEAEAVCDRSLAADPAPRADRQAFRDKLSQANRLWTEAAVLYGQTNLPAALAKCRESMNLASSQKRIDFVKSLERITAGAGAAKPASDEKAAPRQEPGRAKAIAQAERAPSAGSADLAESQRGLQPRPGSETLPARIPPPTDFTRLTAGQYAGAVSVAMEGLRTVYGEMTPEQEKSFQNTWMPMFAFPNKEVIDWCNRFNPLLSEFLGARTALNQAVVAFDEAQAEIMTCCLMEDGESLTAALANADLIRRTLESLNAALQQATGKIEALGDPPNALAAMNAARKRHQEAFTLPKVESGAWVLTESWSCRTTSLKPNERATLVWTLQDAGSHFFVWRGVATDEKAAVTYDQTARLEWSAPPLVLREEGGNTLTTKADDGFLTASWIPKGQPASARVLNHPRPAPILVLKDRAPNFLAPAVDATISVLAPPVREDQEVRADLILSVCSPVAVTYYRYEYQTDPAKKPQGPIPAKVFPVRPQGFMWLTAEVMTTENWAFFVPPRGSPPMDNIIYGGLLAERIKEQNANFMFALGVNMVSGYVIPKTTPVGFVEPPTDFTTESPGWAYRYKNPYKIVESEIYRAELPAKMDSGSSPRQVAAAAPKTPPPAAKNPPVVAAAEAAAAEAAEVELSVKTAQLEFQRNEVKLWETKLAEHHQRLSQTTDPNSRAEVERWILWAKDSRQRAQDEITRMETGDWMHTRTEMDRLNEKVLAAQSAAVARRFDEMRRSVDTARRLVELAPPEEQAGVREFLDRHVNAEVIASGDVAHMRQAVEAVSEKIAGLAQQRVARAEENLAWHNAVIESTERVKGSADLAMTGLAVLGGTAVSAVYFGGTGYIDGGVVKGVRASASAYSPVLLLANQTYDSYQAGGLAAAKSTLAWGALVQGGTFAFASLAKKLAGPAAPPGPKVTWQQVLAQEEFQLRKAMGRQKVDSLAGKIREKNAYLAKIKAAERGGKITSEEAARIRELDDVIAESVKDVKTDFHSKLFLKNNPALAVDGKPVADVFCAVDRKLMDRVVREVEEKMRAQGIPNIKLKSFRNSASKGSVGMDDDIGVIEPLRFLRQGNKTVDNPAYAEWLRSLSKNGKPLTPEALQREGHELLEKTFREVYKRPTSQAFLEFTTSCHPEAYRQIVWLGRSGSKTVDTTALARLGDMRNAAQAGDVTLFKVSKLAQGHPSLDYFSRLQEQSRQLVKDIDTKLLPYLDPATMVTAGEKLAQGRRLVVGRAAKKAVASEASLNHIRQLRDVMNKFAKDEIDPITAERLIRNLSGQEGVAGVADRFRLLLKTLAENPG